MPPSILAARRNLAWRIERVLRGQIATPTMTGWQADQVFMAIEHLDGKQFADGERTMLMVEKAVIFEPADYVPAVQHDARTLLYRLLTVIGQ